MTAFVKNPSHQYSKIASINVDFSNLPATGVWAGAFDLPAGAVPLRGAAQVITLFNPGTSLVASLGTVLDDNKYLSAIDMETAAATAVTLPFVSNAALEHVGLTFTLVGAVPTAGRAVFWIEYMLPNQQHETVG